MRYLFASYTERGKRKEINQDSMMVDRGIYHGQEAILAVICDGIGGLKHGELASAEVVNAFARWFKENFQKVADQEEFEDELYDSWEVLLQDVHQRIREYGRNCAIRIGTTATVMLLWNQEYFIAHVGDCRIYEIQDQIRQMTKDQVQARLNQEGRENVLLQGIGASKMIRPTYHSGEIKEDAIYLLCTDGFRNKVSDQELYTAFAVEGFNDEESMEEQAKKITEMVMERGEKDNISVILLRTFGVNKDEGIVQ